MSDFAVPSRAAAVASRDFDASENGVTVALSCEYLDHGTCSPAAGHVADALSRTRTHQIQYLEGGLPRGRAT